MNFFLGLVRFLSIFAFVKIAISSIMDISNRRHRIINILLLFLMLSASPLFAQNLIPNGEFETSGGYTSEYERIFGPNGVGAGQYAIDNTTENHGGGQGWPQPANSSGRFMIVNGFGGNTNPTKIVWTTQQPIEVTTNTNYTFSCRVANLNLLINGQIQPAKLQLKINGANVGGVNQLPTNNDWHEWTLSWNSQNATQAVIEIYDMFTGNSGLGDDYALDGMSFVSNVTYSVAANNDTDISVCQDVSVDIDVLANDVITPNANDAVVEIVTGPLHGEYEVLPNNRIRYTFTGGNYTTDQIKYRVSTHGVSSEAWVYVNLNRTPDVGNIVAPDVICVGESLGIQTPSVSPEVSGNWTKCQTQNGTYVSFDPSSIPASMNSWWVRYSAANGCGEGHSNAVQITVAVEPDFTEATPQVLPICAGASLTLTPPAFSDVGSEVLSQGWVASPTESGNYNDFSLNNIPASYDGWYIRYRIENGCGEVYSVPARQLVVNVAPEVTGTLQAPLMICNGEDLDVSAPGFSGDGTGEWEICQTQNGTYQPFDIQNVSTSYNDWYMHYKVSNECGDDYSNVVQIHVSEAPEIAAVAAPEAICAGGSFSLTTPTVQNHGATILNQGWQIAATQTGDYSDFNNNNVSFDNNGYWIRYFAENDCGETFGDPVQITVYSTEPVFDTISACDTYVWNGLTCNHSDDFQTTIQSPDGCDIAAHLHFVLSNAYTETQTYSSCGAFIWNKNGQTYTDSGTYEYTVESGNPLVCDSIYTLSLTVNNAPVVLGSISAPATICAGNSLNVITPQYEMNHVDGGDAHWEYATSSGGPFTAFNPNSTNWNYGTYYVRFAVVNGCDEDYSNVVSFHVDDAPVAHGQLSALQVCEGQMLDLPEVNVTWNNENESERLAQWQMSSTENGDYTAISPTMTMQASYDGNWLRFLAHNACGDDIVGPVRITVIAEAEEWLEAITECDAYVLATGEVITESQTIDYETYDPCYHVIHQPVVINHSDEVTERITSCHESYTWQGMTFYHSSETQYATVTLSNATGCDSIVNLQLDFGAYSTFTHDRTSCGSYVWEMNPDQVYTQSVRDSVFVAATNEDECDTWYYLNLTLGNDTLVEGGSMTECSGFVWHGVPYYEDAIVYDSLLTSVTRCDSIVAYQLHIIAPVATDTSIVACKPIWWQEHYCETEGDYQHLFQSVYGCDSLVTVHFSLSEELLYEFDTLACEPFQWYEHHCDADGMTYSHLFQTVQGCDSTVVLHVGLREAMTLTEDVQACDYYEYDGVIYDQPGITYIYSDTLQSQAGCDSIVQIIRLDIKDSDAIGVITGSPNVFVASNLVSGLYRYELDTVGVVGEVTWTLSNDEWRIVEAEDNHCLIKVITPGTNTLKASFVAEDCGLMERTFEIYADYFGVEEQASFGVQVYPNPTKGTLTIEAEGIENIRLIDMMGQVLETYEGSHSDSVVLNLNSYKPSVYLLEVKTDKGVVKQRVVLCR